jgi:hypothetical protein
MTDYYDNDDGLHCDGEFDDEDAYYPPDGYRNYDSDSYYEDDMSVDSDGEYRRPMTPSTPFCRMKSVAEEEEIVETRPKYAVFTSNGWTAMETPESEIPLDARDSKEQREVLPPPKAKFSWNAPKPVVASKDLSAIFSEQEAEAERDKAREEALKNRRQQGPPSYPSHQHHQHHQHYHRDDRAYRDDRSNDRGGQNRRPRQNRPPREQMPQSHGRLLANPNSRAPTVVASRSASPGVSNPSMMRDRREPRFSEGDGRGVRQDNRQDRRPERSDRSERQDRSDSSGRRNDLLCIYPSKHNLSCKLPHSLEEWEPKLCKYTDKCSRKDQCSFWHTEIESKEQYLTRALRQDIVFFRKNRNQYLKTYKIHL